MSNKFYSKAILTAMIVSTLPVNVMAKDVKLTKIEKKNVIEKDIINKEGMKYISVKDYAELKGKKITWDKENRAIYIGSKPNLNLQNTLSMEDFIKEYNVYSKTNKDYGSYLKGFKDEKDNYSANKNIKFNIKNKEYLAKNINLDEYMYPVYNQFSKVRFSLAVSKETKINQFVDGQRKEKSIALEGGAPRVKALKNRGNGFDQINLVSKLDYEVTANSKKQPEQFEINLNGVYALELPKNAIDIEFIRDNKVVRVYEDGKQLYITDYVGKYTQPININGKFYIPNEDVEKSLVGLSKLKNSLAPKDVIKKYGATDYEKNIAEKVEINNIYMYNPRTKNTIKLNNVVHIPDAELKLNKEFSKIRGYHSAGVEVFKMEGNQIKNSDKNINEKYNSGTIRTGKKVIYDSSSLFKDMGSGEILEYAPEKARLKEYVPGNIVYFEIDVKNLESIRFNNFNAMNLEFIR